MHLMHAILKPAHSVAQEQALNFNPWATSDLTFLRAAQGAAAAADAPKEETVDAPDDGEETDDLPLYIVDKAGGTGNLKRAGQSVYDESPTKARDYVTFDAKEPQARREGESGIDAAKRFVWDNAHELIDCGNKHRGVSWQKGERRDKLARWLWGGFIRFTPFFLERLAPLVDGPPQDVYPADFLKAERPSSINEQILNGIASLLRNVIYGRFGIDDDAWATIYDGRGRRGDWRHIQHEGELARYELRGKPGDVCYHYQQEALVDETLGYELCWVEGLTDEEEIGDCLATWAGGEGREDGLRVRGGVEEDGRRQHQVHRRQPQPQPLRRPHRREQVLGGHDQGRVARRPCPQAPQFWPRGLLFQGYTQRGQDLPRRPGDEEAQINHAAMVEDEEGGARPSISRVCWPVDGGRCCDSQPAGCVRAAFATNENDGDAMSGCASLRRLKILE